MLREQGWHIDKTKVLQFKSVSISPESPRIGDKIEISLIVENTSDEVINEISVGVRKGTWGNSKHVTFSPKEVKKIMLFLNAKNPSARESSSHAFNVEAQYGNKFRKLADFELTIE